MSTTKKEVEITVEHPLEEAFDIESGTTIIPRIEQTTEMVVAEMYDEKDNEVETQFNEIYDKALSAYDSQAEAAELVEGKYKARVGEVSVQFLNTALAAAQAKSALKQHKDKTAIASGRGNSGAKNVTNNILVADRNEILRHLTKNN